MLVRDDALLELPPTSAAFIAALADGQAQLTLQVTQLVSAVSVISAVVAIPVAAQGTHKCTFCRRWLVPDAGTWPAHEIAAGPSGRRNGPICPRSGKPVEQTTGAVA